MAGLWAAGTLGVQVQEGTAGETVLEAYFDLDAGSQPGSEELRAALERSGARLLDVEALPDEDWLEPWRSRSRPFPLGRHFEVDPGEPAAAGRHARPRAGRHRLRLPARSAFGVGTHATTRLLIDALESRPLSGRSLLDVGTGTGILAFAALLLGADRVVAFDDDPAAGLAAAENCRRNELHPGLFVGRLAALFAEATFDLVLVNVLPERISGELEPLVELVSDEGSLLLTGLLWERRRAVEGRLRELGLVPVSTWRREEWAALELVRGPRGARA